MTALQSIRPWYYIIILIAPLHPVVNLNFMTSNLFLEFIICKRENLDSILITLVFLVILTVIFLHYLDFLIMVTTITEMPME